MCRRCVANHIITGLVDGESILSAALCDADGFTIERTSTDFSPNFLHEILDYSDKSNLVTIVGENYSIVISKVETGHIVIIQTPNGGNLGKARMKLSKACKEIVPYL